MTVNILIADDEIKASSVAQKSYKNQISNVKIVYFAGDGTEAIQIIEANRSSLDLILVDLKMSPMGGIDLINYLTAQHIPIKVIAISAYISSKEIEDNFQNNENVLGFLEKPFNINKLNRIIESSFPLTLPDNNFDYAQFDAQTSVFVREQTEEIRGLMRKTAQGILDIGQKLLDIKEKLGHGNFLNWLKTEFNWSEPTAQRFMQVARQFKSINLMNLEIAPSALYILSAPSTPDVVREEAISRAQAGENITYSTAKEIKQQHQPDSKTKAKQNKKLEQNKDSISSDSLSTDRTKSSLEQKIVAIIPKVTEGKNMLIRSGLWYQLGKEHLLYCGEPDSQQFRQRLPKQVALNIAFPDTSAWQLPDSLEANSKVVFYSRYHDVDPVAFKEMIQRAFELYTEDGEEVVFSYLPEAELLITAHQLGCRCFIAEPNIERCQSIIATWNRDTI